VQCGVQTVYATDWAAGVEKVVSVRQGALDDLTRGKSFWCNSRDVGDIQSEFGQYVRSVALQNPPHLLVVDDYLKCVGVLFGEILEDLKTQAP